MKTILFLVICAAFSACSRTIYVPIQSSSTDSSYKATLEIDSIFIHDSIYVVEKTIGDTVFLSKTVWKWRDRKKVGHDTTTIIHRDSIPVPYPVEKEVEVPAKISRWNKAMMSLGKTTLAAIALLGVGFLLKRRFF